MPRAAGTYASPMAANGEISVTYINGVLKPDQRLNFPEGARLRSILG